MKNATKADNYNNIFPTRLRDLMKKRNIKQSDLAEKLGVSRQAVGQYKDGKAQPNIETIKEIAKEFDVSADYLLGLSETPTTDKDLQFVCEYTGLTEKAIENLRNIYAIRYMRVYNDILNGCLNDFLSHPQIKKVFHKIEDLMSIENELELKYKEYSKIIECKLNRPISELLVDYNFTNRSLLADTLDDLCSWEYDIEFPDADEILKLIDDRASSLYSLSRLYDGISETVIKKNFEKEKLHMQEIKKRNEELSQNEELQNHEEGAEEK